MVVWVLVIDPPVLNRPTWTLAPLEGPVVEKTVHFLPFVPNSRPFRLKTGYSSSLSCLRVLYHTTYYLGIKIYSESIRGYLLRLSKLKHLTRKAYLRYKGPVLGRRPGLPDPSLRTTNF
ncbi:hypothetical protein N7537_010171 [Penicillium hordei]|uniref:Uncharacterized protein n=1 Tax=Penicillium hordei TaxID=40994 RepID=A0AAD6GXC1_9EURO|nr:uncharacterized protein N7537_010171 [Penicillium hordei]KAJ5593267.1 hypothetical protein N7537_010171 [Penicillium hordei]